MDIIRKIFVLLLLFAVELQASEVNDSIFTTKGIGVQAEAPTFYDAKTNAIQQGFHSGISKILYQVSPYNHYWKVKEAAIGDLESYVDEFQLYNEEMGANTYKAKLEVKYGYEKIQSLLEQNNIPYKFELAPKMLIVPILIKDNKVFLWEKTSWDAAWGKVPNEIGLLNISLAMGDLEDHQSIKPNKIDRLHYPQLFSSTRIYAFKCKLISPLCICIFNSIKIHILKQNQ